MMLHLNGVTYRYPFQAQAALRHVTLSVAPGEAVLVTGPSGGGKSTLLRVMNGLIPQVLGGRVDGRVVLAGRDTVDLSLRDISRIVSALFQDPEKQFLALNVYDEVAFSLEWRETDPRVVADKANRAIAAFNLEPIRDASIYELSEGQKQKVALASLSALTPRVVTLDEPSANLDPAASIELAEHLAQLKSAGVTLIIADHRLAWLKGLVEKVVVVDNGRVVATGDWSLLTDAALRERYGLRAIQWPDCADVNDRPVSLSDALACWEGLTFAYPGHAPLFDNTSIGVARSSITALSGPNGCGKTTLARLLAGLIRPKAGTLYVNGRRVRPRDLLVTTGMAMQNSELQLYQRTARREVIHAASAGQQRLDAADADRWLGRFGLGSVAERHPQSLSGGQKQRLVVACAAARAGELLVLDEPTSGLDGAQMRALAELLDERRDAGLASLVITHDLELIDRVCDRRIHLPVSGQPRHAARTRIASMEARL